MIHTRETQASVEKEMGTERPSVAQASRVYCDMSIPVAPVGARPADHRTIPTVDGGVGIHSAVFHPNGVLVRPVPIHSEIIVVAVEDLRGAQEVVLRRDALRISSPTNIRQWPQTHDRLCRWVNEVGGHHINHTPRRINGAPCPIRISC